MNPPASLRINGERLRRSIDTLASFGALPEGGITRTTFSKEYEAARHWLKEYARQLGLQAYDDAVGNTFARYGDRAAPCVLSGSHIDTVPGGGPLDGAYGVLAAVEVAATLQEHAVALPLAFEACAFVEEEGRFFDLLGSKAVAGQLSVQDVESARDADGVALPEAMLAAGFNPAAFATARRSADDVRCYVELHIEQGPVLEAARCPIGVVDEITGGRQVEYVFSGETGHAGTVPMSLRRDAFNAALEFMYRARQMVLERGTRDRVRVTFGVVEVAPGFPSKIPSSARVVIEIRDFERGLLDSMVRHCSEICSEEADRHRVECEQREICVAHPAQMHPRVRGAIRQATDALGVAAIDMPSGAGHDAQVIATIAPSGMIFVPSKGGVSHRRDEWTDFPDLVTGANVLLHTVLALAR